MNGILKELDEIINLVKWGDITMSDLGNRLKNVLRDINSEHEEFESEIDKLQNEVERLEDELQNCE